MICGDNVCIRPVMRSDLERIEAWENDANVQSSYNTFALKPLNGLEASFNQSGLLDDRQGMLVVVTPAGDLIGTMSYHQVGYGPNSGSRTYNMGISVHPDWRGKGLGTEAQRLLAAYLFDSYPIMRVEAATDITNVAEQRSLEKAGFTREGVMRKAQWRAGEWHDLVVYSKLRGE